MANVRVLRILEYIGDAETVNLTLARGSVPANGEHVVTGKLVIKSGIIGFPEFGYEMPKSEETPDA